jgi:flagellar biosynthetic protein FliO
MIFAASAFPADDIEQRPLPKVSNGNGNTDGLGWIVTVLIALAVVVAAIYLLLRMLRRFFPSLVPAGGQAAPIRPLARFHLAPRQALHLVRCGQRLLLLGATSTSINHVATIDDPQEIEKILQVVQRGESPLAGLSRFLHRSSRQTPKDQQ